MAITHHKSSATIRGITYNYGQAFVCASSQSGSGDSQGNGAALALDKGVTYYFYGYATGDDGNLTAFPYLIYVNQSTIRGWYKENVFPYATSKVTFNPNGGTLPNPGGNLYTSTNNTNSVTMTYDQNSYWSMSSDIPTLTGYTFDGWFSSATGGIKVYDAGGKATNDGTYWKDSKWAFKGDVTLYAQWTANIYTNTISHWLSGLKNQEGNNSDKSALKITDTSFKSSYRTAFAMGSNRQTTMPNGFSLRNVFRTPSISGSWNNYNVGTSVTQVADDMWFEYYYDPIAYNITYNLEGGTNNSENPSTYNVLYELTLKTPTRTGYGFDGWYSGSTKITSINKGCNATFTNTSDLYSKLSSRTTGNITLTAKWIANAYDVIFNANGGINAPNSQTKTQDIDLTLTTEIPKKIGYTFVSWNTRSDGSGITFFPGSTFTLNSTTTLYAIWEAANIASIKVNNEYKLCYTYYNENGVWKPAVMNQKILNSWKRSIT